MPSFVFLCLRILIKSTIDVLDLTYNVMKDQQD